MKTELISQKTRIEFREYLVSWTIREISHEFEAADISSVELDYAPGYGLRRATVDEYYATLDYANPSDVRKLLKAYEYILTAIQHSAPEAVTRLCGWLEKDGYVFQDGRISRSNPLLVQYDLRNAAFELDANYLNQQIDRINGYMDDDPASAIGEAKDLLESCCKVILDRRAVSTGKNPDLPHLMKATLKELNLAPEDISDHAKGVDAIRILLSNLGAIAQNLATLRNLYGSGHGRDGKWTGLQPRHAKLTVGAAMTAALFLIETYQEQSHPQS